MVGICMRDETNSVSLGAQVSLKMDLYTDGEGPGKKPPAREVRRMVTPRDDLRPLYLNTQGVRVGKAEEVLQIREKDSLKEEVRIGEICQLNLMVNVQMSTQAIHTLFASEVLHGHVA